MSVALAVLGAALVLVALYDVVKTTLSAQGGASVTSALSAGLWALLGRGPAHGLPRRAAGGTILAAVPVAWTLVLWAGWTLVFASADGAVVDASSQTPADLPARVYFVGFTLFTLGNGDFVPSGPAWRVLTAVASFSGLFLVTLAITYLLPVVQAVAEKRSLAGRIHSLGATGAAIAGQAPSASLERQLESVAADLTLHAECHLVYPVLHYFESDEARTALAPASPRSATHSSCAATGSPRPTGPTVRPSARSSPLSTTTSRRSGARSSARLRTPRPRRRPRTSPGRPTTPSPPPATTAASSGVCSAPSSASPATTGPAPGAP